MTEISEHIKNILNHLPDSPGVYQYFNKEGAIIYVGKAKNLSKRVSSYFYKDHSDSPKTRVLVKRIEDIKYIVVNSEEDALLLENNLIKEHQPRYNVLLKDDKTYPHLCIKNEPFPRILKTRHVIKDGSEYFGPYSSVPVLNTFLELIHKTFQLRTCNYALTDENIERKKFKVCLQYHIKRCEGPCEGLQTSEDYRKTINEIREMAKGNIQALCHNLWNEMIAFSNERKYEEAQKVKEKYEMIERYRSRSIIVSQTLNNIDVFSYDEQENSAYINILHVVNGCVVQGLTIEYRKRLDESRRELLGFAIFELRERLQSKAKEMIVPFLPDLKLNGVTFTIPKLGDKKKLLDLSKQNVQQYKFDKLKQTEKLNIDQRATRILSALQNKLKLEKLPMHIECFDNSNIQGSDAVAACVVYKKAKPATREYRHYNIKTVIGPDDYASMKEVVSRRYTRLLEEASPLPDLIIADGGAGQMEMIRQALEELDLKIPIAGLAKNKQHRTNELLFGFPPKAIGMKATDELYKFLARMQDEVHRVAITFHKLKRSKGQITSELDTVKGIGTKTKQELLTHFKSVERIKKAPENELAKVVGNKRASIIYAHFNGDLSASELLKKF